MVIVSENMSHILVVLFMNDSRAVSPPWATRDALGYSNYSLYFLPPAPLAGLNIFREGKDRRRLLDEGDVRATKTNSLSLYLLAKTILLADPPACL